MEIQPQEKPKVPAKEEKKPTTEKEQMAFGVREYEQQREVFPRVVGPEEKESGDSSCLPQGEDRGTEESD